ETPPERAAPAEAKATPIAPTAPATPTAPVAAPAAAMPSARRRISPAARKRAAELGLDVAAIMGSGPEGAVTLEDVERAAAKLATAAPHPADKAEEMRRAMAAAMARSK